jgi:hypothetical protein
MEIAVVFESMYGVTHEVAEAIAEGAAQARPEASVVCLRVGDAQPERMATADLLVVGGPTHMRGMSSGMTRKMAVKIEQQKERDEHTQMGHGLVLQRQLWRFLSAGSVVGGAGLGLASSAPPGPVRGVVQIRPRGADEGVEQAPQLGHGQRDELLGSGCGSPFSAVARVALR